MTFKDGSVFEGEFENDEMNGKGIYVSDEFMAPFVEMVRRKSV
jgi:hypothetical protein